MSEKDKFYVPEQQPNNTEIIDVEKYRTKEMPHDVADWMERLETNNQQTNLISDINQTSQNVPVLEEEKLKEINTTKETFITGFKKPIDSAHKWMSEFVLRFIKINKGKVKFKTE